MKKGIVGKKIGMTQIFTEDGRLIPVTVIQAGPCPVVQKKTVENDGYEAIQVGFDAYAENRAEKLVNKPLKGHHNCGRSGVFDDGCRLPALCGMAGGNRNQTIARRG